MNNEFFVGVDLGTSSLKLGISNKAGKLIFEDEISYPLITDKLNSEQKPSDWWLAVKNIFLKVDKKIKSKIKGISFSGQMHGMVLINDKGDVIRNAILWNDMRTFKEVDYLNNIIGQNKISKWTGNKALEGFTAPKILWIRENEPKSFSQIHKILLPKDFLIYKLTNKFATDHSDASGTLYYDVSKKQWSKEMLGVLKIDISQLPEIYKSFDVVSEICLKVANDLGISPNAKIIIGGADNPIAALSLGVINEGDASLSLGTSGVVYMPNKKCLISPNNKLHTFVSAIGDYYQMGVTISAAGSIKWLTEKIIAKKDFAYIEQKINIDKKSSLMFHPYISGERTPINDPMALGSFVGISNDHNDIDFFSSVIEGVSFSIKEIFEIIKHMGMKLEKLQITGGGSKSDKWCQLLSSILNIDIYRQEDNYGALFGAVIAAMLGTKAIKKAEIFKIIKNKVEIFKPNKKTQKQIMAKYEIWKKVYPNLKSINHELNDYLNLK